VPNHAAVPPLTCEVRRFTSYRAARRAHLCIGRRGPSTVDVAAPAPAERLGAQLPLKQHETPNGSAVRSDIGLKVGGHLADRVEVDAEQFRALLKRRRDRPAEVGSRPSHVRMPGSLPEHRFEQKPGAAEVAARLLSAVTNRLSHQN
jgi:hypothetical protein